MVFKFRNSFGNLVNIKSPSSSKLFQNLHKIFESERAYVFKRSITQCIQIYLQQTMYIAN